MSSDIRYWIALHRINDISNSDYHKIIEKFNLQEFFQLTSHELKNTGIKQEAINQIKSFDWSIVDKDLKWLGNEGNHIVRIIDSSYPDILKEIPNPPVIIYVKGNVDVISHPQIAITGSRSATSVGKKTAESFAFSLSGVGLSIVSGLGLGIDTSAHEGALLNNSFTVGVLGTGLDRVYPASNRDLALKIIKTGALISEFPLGTQAVGANFPLRNRIISGLSVGVLIVEAAKESGSLITAKLAIEQNKEVFAIPGSIHNPLSKGCNQLIKEGAKLADTVEDIYEELSFEF